MVSAITTQAAAIGIGTYYLRYYALYAAALVALVVFVRTVRHRLPDWLPAVAHGLVWFALIRVLAFDNPLALRFYQRYVSSGSVGPRQWAVLDLDIAEYRRDLRMPRLENLAVGSSQVGAIFSHWVSNPPQALRVYSLAGMKALDYVLNEEAIAAYRPDRVILYLSAFDLTAGPELYSLPLAPRRLAAMWDIIQRLRTSGLKPEEVDGPIHEFVASQLFPEYRYAFLFKAMVKPLFGQAGTSPVARARPPSSQESRTALAAWSSSAAEEPAVDAEMAQHIQEFVGYYYPEWLDYNVSFLKEFIRFCQERGIEVVVAEGQVNPIIRSAKVDSLETIVRSRFAELEMQLPNLTFVPASATVQFVAADYQDLTHVHREAAMKYTAQLSSLLGPTAKPLLQGNCGITFLAGWHQREGSGDGWLRWSDGSGQLRLTATTAVDLVLHGDLLSLVRPNVVDITVDGRVEGSLTIDDTSWTFHPLQPVNLHLDSGQRVLISFAGHAAPARQATDQRLLSVAVQNLSIRSADGKTSCELMPDARRSTAGI